MNKYNLKYIRQFSVIVAMLFTLGLAVAAPVQAGEYPALKGLDGISAVFDVSLGSPAMANIVFEAVKGVCTDSSVRALPQPPKIAIVFHGPAVNLITTHPEGYSDADLKALATFTATLKQMKKDGVTLEVCDYALKVMGVDPASIIPEVDHVGNGFISVVGYQAKGYSLVTIN